MRRLLIQVPRGQGKKILDIAKDCDGMNLAQFEATNHEGALDLVIVHVPNAKVEELLKKLDSVENLQISFMPRGVIALQPPSNEAPQQVKNVQDRSSIEVFLGGLQSIGSWKGFLGYAVCAGVVVWIGLYTNTTFLLIAAMLIAPFAGPAMNTAIATARGDYILLRQSLLRYFASITVTIGVTWLFSLLLQDAPTPLMVQQSQVASVAVLLPIAAGAAGALNLLQSERSSLVSGAAVGALVAASLAPPAGIVGMAIALGEWNMAKSGFFVLLLQLAAINVSASLLFRFYGGLSTQGSRYTRGKKWISRSAGVVTIVALAALLTWQFSSRPEFQRSTRAQSVVAVIQQVVERNDLAKLVESNVRFTRADIEEQNTLLVVVYVQRAPGVTASAEEIRTQLTQAIQAQLLEQGFNVTPLVDVSVLEPPAQINIQ
jgi:uncharacterized hydrophobic protein (TIGR00271 family)